MVKEYYHSRVLLFPWLALGIILFLAGLFINGFVVGGETFGLVIASMGAGMMILLLVGDIHEEWRD